MTTEIITVQNVRGYIDATGTAHLNAEDVARGLGFVDYQEKDSATSGRKTYEVIRWARINGYLRDLDCLGEGDADIKAGDYIPENWFYLLAMKASNETAKAFQKTVADEILPTLRRTGTYSIKPKAPTPVADIISDVGATADTIQAMFVGVKRGIALSQAIDIVGSYKNFSLESLKQLLPAAEHETGYLNASQVGEKLGLGKGPVAARKANVLLAEKALQVKEGRDWRLTDEGTLYGEEMPYSRHGHSGYQIRWNESVIEELTKE